MAGLDTVDELSYFGVPCKVIFRQLQLLFFARRNPLASQLGRAPSGHGPTIGPTRREAVLVTAFWIVEGHRALDEDSLCSEGDSTSANLNIFGQNGSAVGSKWKAKFWSDSAHDSCWLHHGGLLVVD